MSQTEKKLLLRLVGGDSRNEITGKDIFKLEEPVMCSLNFRNNLWVYECPRYGLHTFSENQEEAYQQLLDEFIFLVDGLMNEPDDALTGDAIELRDLLRNDLVITG